MYDYNYDTEVVVFFDLKKAHLFKFLCYLIYTYFYLIL
jgi:hypothetical protein